MVTYNENVVINSPYTLSVGGSITANNPIWSQEYWQHVSKGDFMTALYNHSFIVDGNPNTTSYIKFYDLEAGHNYVCLYGELSGGEPTLICSQHLAVEKDIVAKGMFDSLEGEITLNAGNTYAPGWSYWSTTYNRAKTTGGQTSTKNPFIWLAQGGISGSYGTLEIRVTAANDNWDWGHLDLGNLTVHGNATVIGGEGFDAVGETAQIDLGDYANYFRNTYGGRVTLCAYNGHLITTYDDADVGKLAFGATSLNEFFNSGYILYYNNASNTGGILPWQTDHFALGSNTKMWHSIYGDWIYAWGGFRCTNDQTIRNWDSLDDLAIIKNVKSKRNKIRRLIGKTDSGLPITDEVEQDFVDFSSMPFLQTEDGYIDVHNLIGFLMGVAKFEALAREKTGTEVEQLRAQVNELQQQVAQLNPEQR